MILAFLGVSASLFERVDALRTDSNALQLTWLTAALGPDSVEADAEFRQLLVRTLESPVLDTSARLNPELGDTQSADQEHPGWYRAR